MYNPSDEKKLNSLKLEIEDSIQKLEKTIMELDDLTSKCKVSITIAKQTLNILQQQFYTIQKPGQAPLNKTSNREQSSVLFVEDELNIRELLKDFVSSNGCAAITAADGQEAILAIQKQHFDLVFLDLKLPRISGVEVLKKIKQTSPNTPVVVVSGNAAELETVQDRAFRPQWVIPKPFKLQQISEALNMWLGSGSSLSGTSISK